MEKNIFCRSKIVLYFVAVCCINSNYSSMLKSTRLSILNDKKVDIILSSGFLAFSRHAGFLAGIEDFGVNIGSIVGTSSGSLAGALFAAGLTAENVAKELNSKRPIAYTRPSLQLHRGVLSLNEMTRHLRTILPSDFSQLKYPLAVGVYDKKKNEFELITEGDLPLAVTASCAIPFIFQPVSVGEPPRLIADGGVIDRLGVKAWANWKPSQFSSSTSTFETTTSTTSTSTSFTPTSSILPVRKAIVHLVEGSSWRNPERNKVPPPPAHTALYAIQTPKSKAGLFSLRDYEAQIQVAYACTAKSLLNPAFLDFMEN